MQMTIISSATIKRMAMMFNSDTDLMLDVEILKKFPEWVRESEAYDELKSQADLVVNRIELPEHEQAAKCCGGDFLYEYLSKGYTCLGNYIGKPKPDMSHLGVHTVQRLPRVGFYLDLNKIHTRQSR